MEKIFEIVSKKLNISSEQIIKTVQLLDEGATIPFIARYRKEITGALDEVAIENIQTEISYIRNLDKRKEEVIRLIEEQGKLTEELKLQIISSEKLQEVEDVYFPYRKKRKTKADIAREKGLEPLSAFSMTCKSIVELEKESEKYITEEVADVAQAIEGAKLILAENISETPEYREKIREEMLKYGILSAKESKKAKELDEKKIYADYYEYSEPVSKMPSHRILATNRGEKEDILGISVNFPEIKEREIVIYLRDKFFGKNYLLKELAIEVIEDSLKRLILPSIEREVRNILTEKAENDSIEVFKLNLKNLLMQSPLKNMAVMALDPGYRTGCKVAIIDKNGFYQKNDVFFLVEAMHHENQLKTARKKMIDYITQYDIDIIAIGNGTASRETEAFVAETLKTVEKKVKYLIVNEAGASIYSASKIAAEEFPELDVTVRGAISIGRR
ncbi:MAG: Tex-like N-terminal domain-containing protein, partial [Fusobacteriaceae bacterium]